LFSLAVPAVLALPVVTTPAPEPKPVRPAIVDVALGSVTAPAQGATVTAPAKGATVEGAAPGTAAPAPVLAVRRESTSSFSAVAVTWTHDPRLTGVTAEVRHRTDGTWSAWKDAPVEDNDVDPAVTAGEARAAVRRDGTDLIWTGPSDGVEARVQGANGRSPQKVRVSLIEPGTSDADAKPAGASPRDTAHAAAGRPPIYSRAAWGADESLRDPYPTYMSTIKAAVVHHTAGHNGYAPEDVPRLLRADYAYHTVTRGWSDFGYNFVVDRFGRIWEGRAGGMDRAVMGAHAGGFNTDTVGVSMLGDYSTLAVPDATVRSVAQVIAWRLGAYYRDPAGTTKLTSAGGSTVRYPAGTVVTLPTVFAHRDTGLTACPGDAGFAKMPTIRSLVRSYLGAGLTEPRLSATSVSYGQGVSLTAGTTTPQNWVLVVTDPCTRREVRRFTGSATSSLAVSWDGKDSAGRLASPGQYDVRLAGSSSTSSSLPWTGNLSVTAPPPPDLPAGAPGPTGPAGFVPVTPTRLLDTRTSTGRHPFALAPGDRIDVPATGVGGVPTSGVAAVVLNLTGVCPADASYVTAWPAGQPRPGTSSLNLARHTTRAGLVVVGVGASGRVSLASSVSATHVIADVVGYHPVSTTASKYHPTAPFRALDTRSGSALAPNSTRRLRLAGLGGLPAYGVTGAVVNITAVTPTAGGHLTAYPASASRPVTSTLNFVAGRNVANRTLTGVSGAGDLDVHNASAGSVHLVVDVVGWYGKPTVPGGQNFVRVSPTRVLDTRRAVGVPGTAPVGPGGSFTLPVAGRAGVPSGASAVVMTVTGTEPTAQTYLAAWPAGSTRPNVSDLNLLPGDTVANLAVVPLANGALSLYNNRGDTHVVADVIGYYQD